MTGREKQPDEFIPIRDIPAALAAMGFPKPHSSVAYRWAAVGVRGRQLRTVMAGGRRFTRKDWLREFVFSSHRDSGAAIPSSRSNSADQADKELDSEGL